ncbi:MAG: hypothetical protein U0790_27110 [Isosphaeraceae bacterium]
MEQSRLQISVAGLLGLVACVAVNIWLFRLSVLAGIIGLNVTKHVVIAYLCQVLGFGPKAHDDRCLAPELVEDGVKPLRRATCRPRAGVGASAGSG